MGRIFTSTCCSTCTLIDDGSNIDLHTVDNIPTEYLEDYQNFEIKNDELKDKYDKIHRVQGDPFNQIHVLDFFKDLEKLKKYTKWISI